MGSKVKIQVAIDDEHLSEVSTVAERLAAAGMEIDQLMPSIGAVTGSIDEDDVALLRNVAGVAAVEHSREIEIPPAESEIQ
jgi:glutaredoxin 2